MAQTAANSTAAAVVATSIPSGLGAMPASAAAQGVAPGIFADAALLLATAASCIFILSALRTGARQKDGDRYSSDRASLVQQLAPLCLLLGQSYFWACHGLGSNNHDLARFNGFLCSFCLLALMLATKGCKQLDPALLVFSAVAAGAMLTFTLGAVMIPILREPCCLLAVAAFLLSIVQSLLPLPQALLAVRRSSSVGFPMALTASGFCSNCLWALYAVIAGDGILLCSSLASAMLSAVVLGIVTSVIVNDSCGYRGPALQCDDQPLMPRAPGKKTDQDYGSRNGSSGPCVGSLHHTVGKWANAMVGRRWAMAQAPWGLEAARSADKLGNLETAGTWDEYQPLKKSAFGKLHDDPIRGQDGDESDIDEPELEPPWDIPEDINGIQSLKQLAMANKAFAHRSSLDCIL